MELRDGNRLSSTGILRTKGGREREREMEKNNIEILQESLANKLPERS